MGTQEIKLSDFIDFNRVNKSLVSSIYEEYYDNGMECMYVLDLLKGQVADCGHPFNILKENNCESLVTISPLSDFVDSIVANAYQI